MKSLSLIVLTALAATVFACLAFVVVQAASLPVVQKTWPDKQCVRVIPEDAGTCADLPSRYHNEWVAK